MCKTHCCRAQTSKRAALFRIQVSLYALTIQLTVAVEMHEEILLHLPRKHTAGLLGV